MANLILQPSLASDNTKRAIATLRSYFVIKYGRIYDLSNNKVYEDRFRKKCEYLLGCRVSDSLFNHIHSAFLKEKSMPESFEHKVRSMYRYRSNGTVTSRSTNKLVDEDLAFIQLVKAGVPKSEIAELVADLFEGKLHSEEDANPWGVKKYKSVRDFLEEVAHKHGFEVDVSGVWKHTKSSSVAFGLDAFVVEAGEYNRQLTKDLRDMGFSPIDIRTLPSELSWYAKQEAAARMKEFKDRVAFRDSRRSQEDGEEELRRYIQAINKCKLVSDEAVYTILRQWMWQVKRKIWHYDVTNHIFPIFYGVQGCGKSTAAQLLFGPLDELRVDCSVPQLADERAAMVFSSNYIVFLDELANLDKADESEIKRFVTARQRTVRHLGSHSFSNEKQNCSVIGSTNFRIKTLFKDTSGMRRYFEIPTTLKGVLDWDVVNDIDYGLIWRAIDEENNHGPLDICSLRTLEEITEWQASCTPPSPVEIFLEQQNIYVEKGGTPHFVKMSEFSKQMTIWSKDSCSVTYFHPGQMKEDLKRIGCSLMWDGDENKRGHQWLKIPLNEPESVEGPLKSKLKLTMTTESSHAANVPEP